MTLEGSFVERNCVHLPDVNGFQSQIPVTDFEAVRYAANQSDNARAYYQHPRQSVGKWFDRDALNGAADLIHRDPCGNCDDAPGTEPMDGGELWCKPCNSAAQGSIHDDRTEF